MNCKTCGKECQPWPDYLPCDIIKLLEREENCSDCNGATLSRRAEYRKFKNHLYNELKITKEDIQDLICETVKEQVRHLVNDRDFMEPFFMKVGKDILNTNNHWSNDFSLKSRVAEKLAEQISLTFK